jgi:hypothetical protein
MKNVVRNSFVLICFSALIFIPSCDEDDEVLVCSSCPVPSVSSLNITFIPTWNNVPVTNGDEYEDQFGNRLLQFNFKTFVSNIIISSQGSETELSEIEILELGDGAIELSYSVANDMSFDELKFHTGVPPEYNVDYDPSTWPNSHPLSVQGAAGMHWGWNTGYIFTKFDGKADTTEMAEPTYLYPFAFHTGDDAFYIEHVFDLDIATQTESEAEINVIIHMEKFLDGIHSIDIREDGETHTGGDFELAQQFIDNFNSSLELE